jgi:hypothetical protein
MEKLTVWINGQIERLALKLGRKVFRHFSIGSELSIMAMDVAKQDRWIGVNRHWSAATRAAIVLLAPLRTTRRCRKPNQVVAAGPKIAGH